ncbi:MAG TPA: hypothetical protein VK632_05805 [Verrucomicrobiae bacterium]|nr:hypothetical protein [Verrucomicrobiae bacterium]
MEIFQVTFWLYATALKRSADCVRRNLIVSFAPLAYSLVLSVAGMVAAPLGIIGGFVLGLAMQACASSGLFLIKNMVESGKTDVHDFLKGFTAYIWELITISFILWIPMRVASMALAGVPNGAVIYFCIQIALYILLNPVPEFIYQTRTTGLELLSASYNFIVDNWIEWLLPNIILGIAGYWLVTMFGSLLYDLPGFLQLFLNAFALGLCLTYIMTFRGFLFADLHGSTRRSRLYRYKARN